MSILWSPAACLKGMFPVGGLEKASLFWGCTQAIPRYLAFETEERPYPIVLTSKEVTLASREVKERETTKSDTRRARHYGLIQQLGASGINQPGHKPFPTIYAKVCDCNMPSCIRYINSIVLKCTTCKEEQICPN